MPKIIFLPHETLMCVFDGGPAGEAPIEIFSRAVLAPEADETAVWACSMVRLAACGYREWQPLPARLLQDR